jgi:hypothetical protein
MPLFALVRRTEQAVLPTSRGTLKVSVGLDQRYTYLSLLGLILLFDHVGLTTLIDDPETAKRL